MHTEIKSNKKHIAGPRRQYSKLSGENWNGNKKREKKNR